MYVFIYSVSIFNFRVHNPLIISQPTTPETRAQSSTACDSIAMSSLQPQPSTSTNCLYHDANPSHRTSHVISTLDPSSTLQSYINVPESSTYNSEDVNSKALNQNLNEFHMDHHRSHPGKMGIFCAINRDSKSMSPTRRLTNISSPSATNVVIDSQIVYQNSDDVTTMHHPNSQSESMVPLVSNHHQSKGRVMAQCFSGPNSLHRNAPSQDYVSDQQRYHLESNHTEDMPINNDFFNTNNLGSGVAMFAPPRTHVNNVGELAKHVHSQGYPCCDVKPSYGRVDKRRRSVDRKKKAQTIGRKHSDQFIGDDSLLSQSVTNMNMSSTTDPLELDTNNSSMVYSAQMIHTQGAFLNPGFSVKDNHFHHDMSLPCIQDTRLDFTNSQCQEPSNRHAEGHDTSSHQIPHSSNIEMDKSLSNLHGHFGINNCKTRNAGTKYHASNDQTIQHKCHTKQAKQMMQKIDGNQHNGLNFSGESQDHFDQHQNSTIGLSDGGVSLEESRVEQRFDSQGNNKSVSAKSPHDVDGSHTTLAVCLEDLSISNGYFSQTSEPDSPSSADVSYQGCPCPSSNTANTNVQLQPVPSLGSPKKISRKVASSTSLSSMNSKSDSFYSLETIEENQPEIISMAKSCDKIIFKTKFESIPSNNITNSAIIDNKVKRNSVCDSEQNSTTGFSIGSLHNDKIYNANNNSNYKKNMYSHENNSKMNFSSASVDSKAFDSTYENTQASSSKPSAFIKRHETVLGSRQRMSLNLQHVNKEILQDSANDFIINNSSNTIESSSTNNNNSNISLPTPSSTKQGPFLNRSNSTNSMTTLAINPRDFPISPQKEFIHGFNASSRDIRDFRDVRGDLTNYTDHRSALPPQVSK